MKMKQIVHSLSIAALLLGLFSCTQSTINNHDDLRVDKVLTVDVANEIDVRWEGDTLSIPFHANCYWGIDLLAWTMKKGDNGETLYSVAPAKWMSTPAQYGMGDAVADVRINPNDRSTQTREGYIKVFTGDENLYYLIKVLQAGNPDYQGSELEPLDLYFDFTVNSMNWPTTSRSSGEYVYPLQGVDYSFLLTQCNIGQYLVIYNTGASLGFPALEGLKLTKVTALISSNNKSVRHALISADTAGTEVMSPDQAWPAQPSVEMVYDLTNPQYNTRYYLYCVSGGLPTAGITLHYEP